MTKTTKRERKYGKKEPTETQKSRQRKTEIVKEEMFKVLIDGSGFTKAMNYNDCQKLINKYESEAKRMNRSAPSLVLVKQ